MADRSQSPARSPTQTPEPVRRQIVRLRWRQRLGPVQIGGRSAAGLHGARRLVRVPDQPALPDRPGHRRTDPPLRARPSRLADPRRRHQVRQHPRRRRPPLRRPPARQRNENSDGQRTGNAEALRPRIGTAYLHTVIDDHSRVAYVEICADEKAATAGVLHARLPGSPTAASPSNACCPTTAPATAPCLARHLRRARHHPQTHPPLPPPDQRQNRTLPPHPGRRLGLRPASTSEAERRAALPAGSTSTITTGSTPPSAAHPSAD